MVAFACSKLVFNATLEEKAVCWDCNAFIIEKDGLSLTVRENEKNL